MRTVIQRVKYARVSVDGKVIGELSPRSLVYYGFKKHFRVRHSDNEFALGRNHINGIENFWGLCKVRLSKFRGIHKHNFYLHIKECEFRYNCRNKNLYLILLKEFRCNPLKLS